MKSMKLWNRLENNFNSTGRFIPLCHFGGSYMFQNKAERSLCEIRLEVERKSAEQDERLREFKRQQEEKLREFQFKSYARKQELRYSSYLISTK